MMNHQPPEQDDPRDIDAHIAELVAENEKLQAQVAMLREAVLHAHRQPYPFGGLELFAKAIESTESDWLTKHDQQVRDEAYERAMNVAYDQDCDDYSNKSLAEVVCVEVGDLISNLKGT